jgi:hypothetical protein
MPAQEKPARSRRLPSRYATVLLPLILSIVMTFVITAIATIQSTGMVPGALSVWLKSWGASWLVAFPTILVVLPLARRIVARLVEPPPG